MSGNSTKGWWNFSILIVYVLPSLNTVAHDNTYDPMSCISQIQTHRWPRKLCLAAESISKHNNPYNQQFYSVHLSSIFRASNLLPSSTLVLCLVGSSTCLPPPDTISNGAWWPSLENQHKDIGKNMFWGPATGNTLQVIYYTLQATHYR